MERLAMVVRDDGYDKLLTPITFAYLAAQGGARVDMLFVLWAVRALTAKGAAGLQVDGRHAVEADDLREAMLRDGDPLEIADQLAMLAGTGRVHLYGCRLAAETFGVREEDLLPSATGIVDAMWFLEQRAVPADHCQYF